MLHIMRRFGLPTVDPLPTSTHIVHFYQHGKDLLEVFAQFCCAGLQEGDCCFWLTRLPWTGGLALHELRKRLPETDQLWRQANSKSLLVRNGTAPATLSTSGERLRGPLCVFKVLGPRGGRNFGFVDAHARPAATQHGRRVCSMNNTYTAWSLTWTVWPCVRIVAAAFPKKR
jgi:hypothetical protein